MQSTREKTKYCKPPADLFERQPPSDIGVEKALLGSVMIDPERFDDVAVMVSSNSFYDPAHQTIWSAFAGLCEEGKRVDVKLLFERLKKSGSFDEIGGAAYLYELGREVPTAASAVYYAEIVRDKAMLRALISTASESVRDVYDSQDKASEIVGRAEQRVLSVYDRRCAAEVKSIQQVIMEAMDKINTAAKGGEVCAGLRTGYPDLDKIVRLGQGQMIVIGARPSMGKTALAANIAANAAIELGKQVLVVSLEMAAGELCERLLSSESRVDSHKLQRGSLTSEERDRVIEASAVISTAGLSFSDEPSQGMVQIASAARRMKRSTGLDLLVIDYLQLIEPDNPKDPRQEQVAKISRRLKQLARELEVPVLVMSQLNRGNETGNIRPPTLANLRESGAIEQDADCVIFVHRPSYYAITEADRKADSSAEICVAKQRNGPTGTIKLCWFAKFVRFDSTTQNEELF